MSKSIHKGTELNNVKETWEQNERNRSEEPGNTGEPTNVSNDLQETIREEAAEYDETNPDERTLGGERATVNDDDASA